MPLENRLSNSYDPSMGFAEGIRNLGQILAQGPAIRARAAYMSAEGQRANAMSDEAVAHANLYQSQAEHEDVATAGLKQIGDLANKGLLRTDKEGNLVVDASLASQVLGGVLQQSKGANDAGGGLAKTLGAFNAPVQADLARQNKSDIATAGDQTKLSIADKNVAGRLAAAAGTDASRERISASDPVIIPSGGTEASKTGSILAQGGVSLPAGDERLAPMSFADKLANAGRLSYDGKPQVQATNPKPTPSGSPGQDSQLARMLATVVGDRNKAGTNSIPNVVNQYESGLNYARTNTAFASKPSSAPSAAPDPLLQDNTIKPAAAPRATPTPKDVAYLAAHPEMKAKFEARFGVGSADQYLP